VGPKGFYNVQTLFIFINQGVRFPDLKMRVKMLWIFCRRRGGSPAFDDITKGGKDSGSQLARLGTFPQLAYGARDGHENRQDASPSG